MFRFLRRRAARRRSELSWQTPHLCRDEGLPEVDPVTEALARQLLQIRGWS